MMNSYVLKMAANPAAAEFFGAFLRQNPVLGLRNLGHSDHTPGWLRLATWAMCYVKLSELSPTQALSWMGRVKANMAGPYPNFPVSLTLFGPLPGSCNRYAPDQGGWGGILLHEMAAAIERATPTILQEEPKTPAFHCLAWLNAIEVIHSAFEEKNPSPVFLAQELQNIHFLHPRQDLWDTEPAHEEFATPADKIVEDMISSA
ncbi:MAG: hypothetical protein KatS3mg054_0034 [Chloroflexus sp.]|nr:MAG: hypothetical protein KatS3mg054_0034 [Chloroflexus sp.]